MRVTAVLLALLLLSTSVAAEDKQDLVEFTGLRDLDPDDLLSAGREDLEDVYALLHQGAPDDEILAYGEDAAFEMLLFIRKEGYPLSGITVELAAGRIRFAVAPGPRVFLGEFTVKGVDEKIREELGKYVQTPRTWIFGSELYVESALDGAARRMGGYLRQHGYLDAKVTREPSPEISVLSEPEEWPEELTADVSYAVEPGPLHLLEAVRVTGNLVRTSEQILNYETGPGGKTIRWLLGRPYGPFTPFDVKAIVAEYYGTQGYPFVEITENVSFEPRGETTAAIVDLEISEGPRTGIRAVHIFGNLRTEDTVIRREIGLLPGDLFNITAAADTQRRLIRTGLFRQVFVDVIPPEEGHNVESVEADLTITLKENEFRRLETMVGWGTWELLRGAVSMTWRNIWGQAYEGSVSLEGSVRGFRLAGHLKDPWALPGILWDRTAFIAEGFVENKQRPTFSYVREEVGLILRQREFFENTVTSFGYAYSRTDVYNVTDDLPEEFENRTNIGRLTLSMIRDTRDNPWSPSRGSALGGSLDYANQDFLGGDLSFWRLKMSAIKYLELGAGFVLAGRVMAGAIAPYGATDEIPIQERFYLGGGQTVRSFRQDELGPRAIEDGEPTRAAAGGEFFSLANLELRSKLPWAGLEAVLFVDGGNVIRKVSDASLKDYRFAVGAGIRIGTPIGPLRLDLGVNPNPREYERKWMLFFAVGYPF